MRVSLAVAIALGACSDAGTSNGSDASSDTAALDVVPDAELVPDDAQSDGIDSAAATGLLGGDADSLAIDALPDLPIPLPDVSELLDLQAVKIVRDRVIVGLADSATVGEVNALARTLEARLLGTIPSLGIIVLSPITPTSDLAWVRDALTYADGSIAVADAAPSVVEGTHLVPPAHVTPGDYDLADDTGSDWGLHDIRAPLAWNLQRHLAAQTQPRIVVIDGGFNTHADVQLDAATPITTGVQHGTQVAGVIAARFDAVGIEGVMPVPTTIAGRTATAFPYPSETVLATLVTAIGDARQANVPLIVNMSLGANLYGLTPSGQKSYEVRADEVSPLFGWGESFTQIAERTGALMRRVSRWSADRGGYDRWLFVCSAGNSHVNAERKAQFAAQNIELALATVQARTVSGCGNAAYGGDPHFMSVEALAPGGGRLAHFSSRGGTIAAPGESLALLSGTGYSVASGTSFSSPLVAGAAALLWTYHPGASLADIRGSLLESARPGVGESAPRLDLYAALQHLDELGGPDLGPLLADVDDGSLDGSMRTLPPDGITAPVVAPGARGDGCIDMADFRAMRDALLDVSVEGGHAAFDPASAHRDQNGDGVARFVAGLTEARYSRFDFDGDGRVGLDDLAILVDHFGTCRPGVSDTAVTEGYTALDLPGLMLSVDLFMKLPDAASGDVTVVAPGRARLHIADADVAARTIADHVLVTLPVSACSGALSLRTQRGDAVRTYTTPTSPSLAPGRDYFLSGLVATAVERHTPLVHTHTGPHIYEAVAYEGTGQVLAVPDWEPPFLAAPSFLDDTLTLRTRFAAMRTGGWVGVATDGIGRAFRIAGTSDDVIPVAWSEDGRGLLLRSSIGSARLFWLDLDREASGEIARDIDIDAEGWPMVVDGVVYFFGLDGRWYRNATHPRDGDWLDAARGTAVCETTLVMPAPEIVIDLTTRAAARDLDLPRAYPGAMAESATRLAFIVSGASGRSLRVTTLADDAQDIELVADWEPRGGFETFNLDASDGVAWSPDGRYFLYSQATGVYLVDLGTGGLPSPDSLARIKIHDAPAVVAFDPSGLGVVAITTEGPVSERTARVHAYRPPWGGAAAGIYVHEHRHGAVVLSYSGAQLAVVEKDGTKGNVVVYAPPASTPIASTATWQDPCGAASCTTTSEIMPSWARDLYPW